MTEKKSLKKKFLYKFVPKNRVCIFPLHICDTIFY